ncbi:RING/U-box superfamily protein [Forsythia ovata]|uniref:RING-type E3 ubiquitin transferase n=1 Tax=Forsythia ovata TaxID=205694 RepID=A0ABD1WAU3_9LAMI
MSSICCCFHVPDEEDNAGSNTRNQDCSCPKCCIQNLMNKYRNLFTGGGSHAAALDNQQAAPSNSEAVFDISSNSSPSHDRALLNSGNSGYLQVQQDTVMRLEDKVISQSQVAPEPFRQTDVRGKLKLLQHNIDESYNETASTKYQSESSLKVLSSRVESGIDYEFSSPDDEDVCPTCLEEYTPENPKIIAKCSHHYHLGCIYEWMERSVSCPVCGKIMLFDESV